jgi:hypothetical protein
VGPEAPKLLKPAQEFVFLCHAPCVTLSEERLIELSPFGTALGAPEPWWLGAHLLMPKPWLAPKARREPRFGSRLPSIGSLRLK